MWIVRIALKRPYTFVVLALLILIAGPLTIARTPTDIFPNIDIPVVTVVWNYGGLSAEEMSTRIVSIFERSLTTTVNDIEHIESQSLRGIAVVKVFLQPGAKIDLAVAQVTASAQSQLRQLPPGTQPPFILMYNASTRAGAAAGAVGKHAVGTATVRHRGELPAHPAGERSGRADSVSLRRQAAADPGRSRSGRPAGASPVAVRRRQRDQRPEPDSARRHAEDRRDRVRRGDERQPEDGRGAERSADQDRRLRHDLHSRRRARPQRLPAADQHRPRQRVARGAADDSEGRQRVDARHHQQHQAVAAARPGRSAAGSEDTSRCSISRCSWRPRSRASCARR